MITLPMSAQCTATRVPLVEIQYTGQSSHHLEKQESNTVARTLCNAACHLFHLKFLNDPLKQIGAFCHLLVNSKLILTYRVVILLQIEAI